MIYQDKRDPNDFIIRRWGVFLGRTVGNHAYCRDSLTTIFMRPGFPWETRDAEELLGKLEVPKEFLE